MRPRGARDEVDHSLGVDLADCAVAGIGDVDVAFGIHCHVFRLPQLGRLARTAIAHVTGITVTGYGVHDTGDVYVTDVVVARIGDIQVARGIERQAVGEVQIGGSGRAEIAQKSRRAHRPLPAKVVMMPLVEIYPHPVVQAVGDIQVAGFIECQPLRRIQLRGGSCAAVTGISGP